jgi:hypothetical protein
MNNHFVSINLQHVEHKVLEYVMVLHIQNMDRSYIFHTKNKNSEIIKNKKKKKNLPDY